ncbi:MAG: DsbA family protein [Pseudomonadota bacterium]
MELRTKLGVGVALLAAFALGAVVIAFSSAQQSTPAASAAGSAAAQAVPADDDAPPIDTSFSDLEEDDIRALVRDTLMRNPEIIIEAVNEYSRRQQALSAERLRTVAKANLDALLDPAGGYVAARDPNAAKVAVIEMFDYHCGFCKRAAPFVKMISEQEKDVKIVFREYPILREESDYAAEVALAARDQGKFLDMHFAMMEASGVLTEDRIKDIAKKQGVDLSKLEKSRRSPAVASAIIETYDLADKMGVSGTPAFIIASVDGAYVDVIEGFNPERLAVAIDAAREAAK